MACIKLPFCIRVLRFFNPKEEEHRQEYRKAMQHAQAQAEDLTRTLTLNGKKLAKLLAKGVDKQP